MSPTRDRLLALLQSGQLAHAAQGKASQSQLARSLGMTAKQYEQSVARIRASGAHFPTLNELHGQEISHVQEIDIDVSDWDGDGHAEPMPAGHSVRGVSTYFDGDGVIKGQWVKTNTTQEQRIEQLIAAMPAIAEDWRGKAEPVEVPAHADADLLTVIPVGDPHIGMFSWALETGADFDLGIAERNIYTAADHLIATGPASDRALVILLGDTFHSDSKSNTTTKGTRVDTDTRWPKVLGVGIKLARRVVDRALEKHKHVELWVLRGNHDDHAAIFLSLAVAQFYERDPRVTVSTSPDKFYWHRFGDNLIGATHTDTVKLDKLPGIMACDRKEDWGQTTHRRVYGGHRHHERTEEFPGCTVEILNTLAASDEWHHGQGYRSTRNMKLDVWHRRWGFINRHIVGIEQIEALTA